MKNRIKQLRLEHKLMQKELADKLNVSKPTISKYEDGSIDMSTDILIQCSELFDVSIDYILCRDDVRNRAKNKAQAMKESDEYYRAFKLAKECNVTPEDIEAQLELWKKMKGK